MADKHIVYEFKVVATLPLTDDPQHPDFYTEAVATSVEFRRQLERNLFNWLKRFDGDCDVELKDEYADPRDDRDGRR
jgi:hypothetical protein